MSVVLKIFGVMIVDGFRIFVLYNLPKLKFLDSTPVKMTERTEAQRRGCFLRVARPPSDLEEVWPSCLRFFVV